MPPVTERGATDPAPARLVAFYLPQFHPLDINDRSHGPGFTEWTHVAQARPLFPGHQQPVIPGELGFYDLRVPETRAAQADLARRHGIAAFCYWHYWSDGDRLMDRPFREVLERGEPDLPFCLAWANHSWLDVRNPGRILYEQAYPGLADHEAHFRAIEPALHDPRYLRVDGRPLVYLFRPGEIPDLERFVERWQELAVVSGLGGVHLVGQERRSDGDLRARLGRHLDAMVPVTLHASTRRPLRWRVEDRVRRGPLRFSYADLATAGHRPLPWARRTYPAVLTNWDNTPRWGRAGTVSLDPRPDDLGRLVRAAVAAVADHPPDERIVFVKSWNEWAEGNHLEPDAASGRARLEAVRAALGLDARP